MTILLPQFFPIRDLLLPPTTMPTVLHLLCEFAFKERVDSITTSRPELSDLMNFDVWNLRGHAVSFDRMRPKIEQKVGAGYRRQRALRYVFCSRC